MEMEISGYRLLGLACLFLLVALCLYSLGDSPKNWRSMPPTEYVIENPDDFEGADVYLDGMVSGIRVKGNVTSFTLSPVSEGLFDGIRTEITGLAGLKEGQNVNVFGTMRRGILEGKNVTFPSFSLAQEFFLNVAGLTVFILFSLREWKIKKIFPYIEEAG